MYIKTYIRKHPTLVSILLFLVIFGMVALTRPLCFYNQDGSIREFGIGFKNKTIYPIWLFSITLGILSYLAVLYYIQFT